MRRPGWAAQLTYSPEQWDEAGAEVREAILGAARNRRLITYAEVAGHVTAIPVVPHSPVLWHLLAVVLGDELDATSLALTALVVHAGDGRPGGGFAREARNCGAVFSDPDEYWVRQVTAIFERYGQPS
jgi:hypothetical protein